MALSVVFLAHNYPRFPGDLAGAFLATLAAALVRRGIGVRVIVPSDRGAGEHTTNPDGVEIRRVRYAAPHRERYAYGGMADALRSPQGVLALWRMLRALRRAAAAEMAAGADLIHAHWWLPAGLAAPPGAPLVLTSHGSDAALLRRSWIIRRLAAPLYHRAHVVTAVSSELAHWITTATGRELPQTDIQPMPVDVGRFTASRGGGGAVMVARLVAQKRIALAIDAVAVLAGRGVTLPLTIAGEGPERRTLAQHAEARGVAKLVRFTGAVSPEAIPGLLATADLMFMPARGEGFGLAAAEAYLAGVPVVACRDGGGLSDIVPERGAGRRVEPTGSALAHAALELLDSARMDLTADLAERRAHWQHRLAADTVAAACERWYHRALDGRRAA